MRFHVGVVALFAALVLPSATLAADLFTENFEVDPTANWTVNLSGVTDSDEAANFFFDYSTAGIPLAPNSTGPDRRGLNLQANRDSNFDGLSAFSGFSVSPTGQDFSAAGDYMMTFDLWQNFPGPFPAGVGGTQLSTFGIGSSGTASNWPGGGASDGIYFASTLDGNSSADYRAYSVERKFSYQLPYLLDDPVANDLDALGNPIDSHATYHAYGRNNTAGPAGNFVTSPPNEIVDAADYTRWRDHLGETSTDPAAPIPKANGNANVDLVVDQVDYDLWKDTFGDTVGLYSASFSSQSAPADQLALYPQQTGSTVIGSTGMAWHEVEITKIGNAVTWKVDGVLLISVDTTNFVTPPGGGNILFGQSDTNAGASSDPLRLELLFTLIDNIKVSTIDSEFVGAGGAAVPEPMTLVIVVIGIVALSCGRRGR